MEVMAATRTVTAMAESDRGTHQVHRCHPSFSSCSRTTTSGRRRRLAVVVMVVVVEAGVVIAAAGNNDLVQQLTVEASAVWRAVR